MALEIPRFQPYSEDSRVLFSEAYNLSHALTSNDDPLVKIGTCSGYAELPRSVVFLKAIDNYLSLKDLGHEEHARYIYSPLMTTEVIFEEAA